jgi:hypothetical protein
MFTQSAAWLLSSLEPSHFPTPTGSGQSCIYSFILAFLSQATHVRDGIDNAVPFVLRFPHSRRYAHVISGFGYFDLYFGTALFFIPVVSFLLSLLPRGYPTSVRTQRPESTFWATVTLISTAVSTSAGTLI